jgi:signal transduction histidine kinase
LPVRSFAILLFCLLSFNLALADQSPLPALVPDLPVTNGLIRWWPNLFDVRDEISGQEGVVMGVIPPVETGAEDPTEFSTETGWVQLQPAITNQVFTLSFWVRWGARNTQLYFSARLLGQESDEGEWFFTAPPDPRNFAIGGEKTDEKVQAAGVELKEEVWQHLAIARRANGTSIVWLDGAMAFETRTARVWPSASRWLTVGNELKGDNPCRCRVRDLCAFDWVLGESEVQALHAAGLPKRPARNTAARLAATGRAAPAEISTNVVQTPSRGWVHNRFTTENGLPDNVVKAVLQARNGYLWVGTEDGLARFDGRNFQAFTVENTPALRAIGQTVWSLAEDVDGTIWAGIFGGLLRIRGLEFTAFTNGLPQRFVLQAEPAGDGSVWVAGFRTSVPRGPLWLRRYHPDSGTTTAETVVPGQLRRLIATTNGLWLATEGPSQILFWDCVSATPSVLASGDYHVSAIRVANSATVSEVPFRAWQDQVLTNCWAEVNLGNDAPSFHWLWDPSHRTPWVRTTRWAGPPADDTWLGVLHDLMRRRGSRLERVEIAEEMPGPEIACLCANHEGGVWLGTEEDGLHFLRERLVRVFTTRDGLVGNDVRSVCTTPEVGLWAATDRGASRWREGEWTPCAQDKGIYRSVAIDSKGDVWLGQAAGGSLVLEREHAGERGFVLPGLEWQDPNTLRFARDGTLWVVCERGLTWLKPDRLKQNQNFWDFNPANYGVDWGRYAIGKELPTIRPLGLIEDTDGSMWMGSLDAGLFHILNGRVENQSTGLPGNRCVPTLLEDSGALWVVAEGALCRRAAGRFKNVTVKDGLPKDVFLDMIADDLGNFWIGGKRGIHRVARQELDDFFTGRANHVRTLTLGVRDGLLTPECSSLHAPIMAKTPDGHIWVATLNGMATFDPRRVRLDTQPLSAIIERVVANSQEVPDSSKWLAGGSLTLRPGSGRQLEFHYTAISLVGADRLRFRHRLEGSDSDWSPETDLRLAFYTNLKPGEYRFRVKASNAHGIWNDHDAALSFVILPYFWQTKMFYLSLAGIVIALAAGLHWRRLTVERRIQFLKHQQDLASEKSRIAADMHDELGAALTQIVMLGEAGKAQVANEALTRSTLDRISDAARELTSRMSDLVWATNPRNDTLDNLSAYLREQTAFQLQDASLEARLEFPVNPPERHVSATFRRNLLLITKEALNNVLKHAQATQVTVKLESSSSHLNLQIQDNGRGFEPSTANGAGNGLGNMEKRVHDLDGQFAVRSSPGNGTCLEITLPLNPPPANTL